MTCIKNKIILVQYQIDLIGSKKMDLLYVAITAIEIVKKERLKKSCLQSQLQVASEQNEYLFEKVYLDQRCNVSARFFHIGNLKDILTN